MGEVLVASRDVTVVSGAPFQVTITGPEAVTAGEISDLFTLTVRDAHGNPTAVNADTVFTLTSDSGGSSKFNPHLNLAIPVRVKAGESTATFTYRDTEAGVSTITATVASGDERLVGVSSGCTIKVVSAAMGKIMAYADSNGVTASPTVEDYFAIGVRGVISGILGLVNAEIANVSAAAVATKEEVQAIVDEVRKSCSYDAWAARNNITSGPQGSVQGDDVPNLLKYALGIDPRAPVEQSALPRVGIHEEGGQQYLTLTVDRNPLALDVDFIAEVSDNMQLWESGAGWVTISEQTPERVVFRRRDAFGDSDRGFIRLRVVLQKNQGE